MDIKKISFINRDMIKYIIIFFMFFGHIFAWININDTPPDGYFAECPFWQRLFIELSLITPPVMFFFVADGFKYTRSRKKYALRLLVFGLITQIPFYLLWFNLYGWWNTNVMFGLLFGLLSLCVWESHLKLWQRICLVILCILGSVAVMTEWMLFGPLIIFGLHVFRDKPKIRAIWYFSLWTIYLLVSFIPAAIEGITLIKIEVTLVHIFDFVFAYLIMTVFYNGKKGHFPTFSKWFFYIFYPAHIFLSVLLRQLLIK